MLDERLDLVASRAKIAHEPFDGSVARNGDGDVDVAGEAHFAANRGCQTADERERNLQSSQVRRELGQRLERRRRAPNSSSLTTTERVA